MLKCFFSMPAGLALGAGLLIASAQSVSAAEIAATPVAAKQTQDAGQPRSATTPAEIAPIQQSWPPLGAVGFGWG